MSKFFKFESPLGWRRFQVRAFLALLVSFTFVIMVVADIIALFTNRDMSPFIILTLLTGGLTSYVIGWYYGQRAYHSQEEPKREYKGKPEVLSKDYELDEEEAAKIRESKGEGSES